MDDYSDLGDEISFDIGAVAPAFDAADVDDFAEDTVEILDMDENTPSLEADVVDIPEDSLEDIPEAEDLTLTPQEIEEYTDDISDPDQLRMLRDAIETGRITVKEAEMPPDDAQDDQKVLTMMK
jgi:hypothetical protein